MNGKDCDQPELQNTPQFPLPQPSSASTTGRLGTSIRAHRLHCSLPPPQATSQSKAALLSWDPGTSVLSSPYQSTCPQGLQAALLKLFLHGFLRLQLLSPDLA